MTNNSRRPYEWAAVVSWSLSLFLLGLTTARAPFGSEMNRLALGLFSGVGWAVIGGLIVALWKYFKRSPAAGKTGPLDVSHNHDWALFIVAIVIAAFLVGKGFYLETYGSLIDAVLLIALGFGVRAGLRFARWLFAIYAFVTPILVIGHGGGNAVIWPFVFFYVCRSIIVQGGSKLTENSYGLRDKSPVVRVSATAPKVSSTKNLESNGNEGKSEKLWAQALAELEGGNRRSGLWAKVFADAQGNEAAAKANYLRDRVRQLSEENHSRALEIGQQNPAAYDNSIKKNIAVVQLSVKEEAKLLEYLRYKGGVHTWVIWVFGLVPVIGILAAVAIPAYHDYSARAKPTRVPQSPSPIASQPSNPAPYAPKWEDLSDTPPKPTSKPPSGAVGLHEIPRAGFNFDADGNRLVNFDVNGALKAGYSKSEIAEYLCNERKLDIAVIRGRGYSDDEIIAKLVAK